MSSLLPPVDKAILAAPSRRTVVGAGLWSVPVLAASSAVPAYATTSDTYVVTLSAPSNSVPAGGTGQVSATVTTSAGVAAAGQPVSLSGPAGAALWSTDGTTDTNGVFTTKVDFSSPWAKPGSMVAFSAISGSASASASFTVLGANLAVGGDNSSGQLGVGASSAAVTTLRQTGQVFPSPVVDVRASGFLPGGGLFALALLADGSVWSVGANGYGQLGDGSTTSRASWAKVAGLPKIASIAALRGNAYAIDVNGDVWSWGEAQYGQLGETAASNRTVPAKVSGLSGVKLIRGANAARLVQKTDGTWWGFGWNGTGLLADGSTTTRTSPVRITALDGFTDVSDGFGYGFVGLKSDKTVWAWGGNKNGQLCDGTTTDSSTPKQIPSLAGVTAIAAAQGPAAYEDATAYVLKSDGTVWGWGYNASEQVDSTKTALTAPVQVTANVTQITASQGNVFALKNDGTIWTRGLTLDGSTSTSGSTLALARAVSTVRGATTAFGGGAVYVLTADQSFLVDVADDTVSAGSASTVTVTAKAGATGVAGVAATLTATSNAALGVASGTTNANGVFSTTVTPDAWTKAGTTVTVSAASDSGQAQDAFTVLGSNLMVAGNNTSGALATGAAGPAFTAVQQSATTLPLPVAQVSSSGYADQGNQFTLALLTDGSVWAVGGNGHGQLGDGTKTSRATWAKVAGLPSVRKVFASAGAAFAITTSGDVWSWGYGANARLGDGGTADRTAPAKVAALSSVTDIASSTGAAFIVRRSDGSWWGWGKNDKGQLADGTTTNVTTPKQLTALNGLTDVSTSFGDGFIARHSDGSVRAWGSNSHGQLLTGTTTKSSSPVTISGLSGVVAVAGSQADTADSATAWVLKSDGTVWAWGKNNWAQISGSGTTITTPTQIASNIAQIVGSQGSVFALTTDGKLWTRGLGLDGTTAGTGSTLATPRAIAALAAADQNSTGILLIAADQSVSIDIPATTVQAGSYTIVNTKVSAGSKAVEGASVSVASPSLVDFSTDSGTTASDGTFATHVGPDIWTAPGTVVRVTAASGPSAASDTFAVTGSNMLEVNTRTLVQSDRTFTSPIVSALSDFNLDLVILADTSVWTRGGIGNLLGDGSTTGRSAWGKIPSLSGVKKASGAIGYRSASVLKTDGTVWSWGLNDVGQLGDGTTTDSAVPVRLQGVNDAVDMAMANGTNFIVRADGTLWAIGYNNGGGMAGIGAAGGPIPLTKVSGGDNVSAVFARSLGGYMLKKDGTLWAWGQGKNGLNGDGTTDDRPAPVQVPLANVVDVTYGYDQVDWNKGTTIARCADGTLYAWGNNTRGQFGNNTTTDSASPVQIPGVTGVKQVLVSAGGIMALKDDGTVLIWGQTNLSPSRLLTPTSLPLDRKVISLATSNGDTYGGPQFLVITDPFRPTTRTAPNLALRATVKASYEHPSYKAPNAVDGIFSSRWVGLNSDPNWLVVDLGFAQRINRVVLRWEDQSAVDYTLAVASDNGAWTDPTTATWNTVFTMTGATVNKRTDTDTFPTVVGRYVRLHITKRSYQYGPGLYEIEVYRD